MKFTMYRDRIVASVYGRAIRFKKGVPQEVPPIMHAEVLAAGGVPDDDVLDEGEKDPQAPTDPVERVGLIKTAMEAIVLRGVREDFTAAGAPTAKAVMKEVGFEVHPKERETAWNELRQAGEGE